MKVFIVQFDECGCHPDGAALAFAYNRGQAVSLINKRLEAGGGVPMPNDEAHRIEELDPDDKRFKKGFVHVSWLTAKKES